MLPAVANISPTAPATTSLVATSLPENFAQRVPYTNVSPTVSSVQINNNARGNGSYVAVENVASYAVPVTDGDAATGTAGGVTPTKIPAAFLAQMIGQSVPPAMQGVLSHVLGAYDEMV